MVDLEICFSTDDESIPPNISSSLPLLFPYLLLPLLPLPPVADVFTRNPLPPPSPPGENESRSIAPPEWILLWQAPPLPATAPATEHATLPLARDTPTL